MVRFSPLRLVCAAVILCVLYVSLPVRDFVPYVERGYDILQDQPAPVRPAQTKVRYGEECSPFRSGVMEGVTIVLKIGAGEANTKLPAYLNRLGRCKQDLLIFSDRKAVFQGFDVVDALSHIRPEEPAAGLIISSGGCDYVKGTQPKSFQTLGGRLELIEMRWSFSRRNSGVEANSRSRINSTKSATTMVARSTRQTAAKDVRSWH